MCAGGFERITRVTHSPTAHVRNVRLAEMNAGYAHVHNYTYMLIATQPPHTNCIIRKTRKRRTTTLLKSNLCAAHSTELGELESATLVCRHVNI